MVKYIKLLIIKCETYESNIIMEYNLSSEREARIIAKRYIKCDNVICLIIDMQEEVGITPLLSFCIENI